MAREVLFMIRLFMTVRFAILLSSTPPLTPSAGEYKGHLIQDAIETITKNKQVMSLLRGADYRQ